MKILFKQALIPVLTSRPITTVTDFLFSHGVPIFMLHRISQSDTHNKHKVSADHLHICLDYLVSLGYSFISLEKVISALNNNKKLPTRSVVFTMDDGYIDQAEIAAPIFLEYNCPVTFFVITGMLDRLIWPWDTKVSWIIESSTIQALESSDTIKKLNLNIDGTTNKQTLRKSLQETLKKIDANLIADVLLELAYEADVTVPVNPPADDLPMTWDIARTLEDQGIRFAPHSVNHNILSRLNQGSMELEIRESWKRIKNELKNPLKVFCYPNGRTVDFGNREIESIKASGFKAAVSTIPGIVKYKSNSDSYIYSLPRLALPDNMTEFIQYCSWIERARAIFDK